MTQETYFCSCGCNLEFYLYKAGLDIYVVNNLYNKEMQIDLKAFARKAKKNNLW